ncbi:membrane protein [Clostridium fallax]|uniref:DUF5668 domain-containing protein n=1 Tax=Clostridium fallax TaxID=1533 RepID=A0A1M4U5K2_9CLOT|nr:hypothetical protein SAMN05443638_10448 [Clostridium fallax]SQB06091.1 membrane protein [Clostridium fallax]
MRYKRIGTITLIISLVFFIIEIIISNIYKINNIIFLIKLWPIIFILLGIEVLLGSKYLSKRNLKIKFSLKSLLILFLIILSLAFLSKLNYISMNRIQGLNERINHKIINEKNIYKRFINSNFDRL